MSEEIKVYDKRVAPVEEQSTNLLELVIKRGLPLETIEKVMELQERHERNEARKAYNHAMAEFKSNPPEITKDKKVEYKAGGGTTKYYHASLANVVGLIGKAMSPHGLSATFNVEQGAGIKVTCTITHRDGHSESCAMTADADTSGSKNTIQAIGSTVSYLERYTLLALTGLAKHDIDDDGASARGNITAEQEAEITALIEKAAYKDGGKLFLEWLGVESTGAIPAADFKKAVSALNDVIKARKK